MTQAAKDAAKFLKSTLRLPSSSFPPRPPPVDLARYLTRCTNDLYSWQRQNRPADQPFRLHDGPPYANGDLHVGHALNKILKDIICRSKLAEGRRIDYTPGWDCHGLPIELKALERNGWKRGQGVDATSIRDAARAFASATVKQQMAGFKSWAVMGDWQNYWKTMDKDFEVRQLRVFQAMAESGLIYRRRKPVFWSPSSGTALAEAELEYNEDHTSQAAYVKFLLSGYSIDGAPVHALIWTTTPWTLPANQAIAVNRNLQYSVVKSAEHGLLVIASSRLSALSELLGDQLEVLQQDVDASDLLLTSYDGLPQFGQEALNRPIIHADFVSADSGTGLVHCAPGHGMEDYLALQPLIKSGRVRVRAPVDSCGKFNSDSSPGSPELLEGQDIFIAGNSTILKLLRDEDRLVHTHHYRHKYPIDWRTKEPVIIRATAQWFADVSGIKDDALHAIEQVTFQPETGKHRLRSFVDGRSEWCISRQRAWGVPIPAIYHIESGEAVLTGESISHILKVIDDRGVDAWWSDSPDDPAWISPNLNATDYRRGTDTMDVWFDSGTSWTGMAPDESTGKRPLADVYLEGTDQHRGWFQSSLLTHVACQKSSMKTTPTLPPFSSLITHGFTLDAHGKKMSKSQGNVISPDQIIKGFHAGSNTPTPKSGKKSREVHPLGPDALRLWVASSDWTTDVVISETVVKTVHKALDKYRVTIKLLLGLLQDFDPQTSLSYDQLMQLDRIALLQLAKVAKSVQHSFSEYEFHKAITAINRWVVADLSGFYFEAIKDISYCDSLSSSRRISVCTTVHHILCYLQSMLAPVTPLLVEESWEHSPATYKSSLTPPLQRTWPEAPAQWLDEDVEKLVPTITAVNSSVKAAQEEARSEKLLGQSLASDIVICARPDFGVTKVALETWKEVLVVSDVVVGEAEDFDAHISDLDLIGRSWHRSASILTSNNERCGTVLVASPAKEKCARCWRYAAEAKAEEDVSLCGRCTDVVKEFQQ